eukprot:TRINITY_DN1081_c0_g1_i1.p1 TRINITY_DN1081_c0_g1~~TRINITY_DN1081_c0_g1_i1.p1  ORF type:complete len:513 (+),score=63.34 TRINITY_DN1081_c0_g1_i1:1542-3080(+)
MRMNPSVASIRRRQRDLYFHFDFWLPLGDVTIGDFASQHMSVTDCTDTDDSYNSDSESSQESDSTKSTSSPAKHSRTSHSSSLKDTETRYSSDFAIETTNEKEVLPTKKDLQKRRTFGTHKVDMLGDAASLAVLISAACAAARLPQLSMTELSVATDWYTVCAWLQLQSQSSNGDAYCSVKQHLQPPTVGELRLLLRDNRREKLSYLWDPSTAFRHVNSAAISIAAARLSCSPRPEELNFLWRSITISELIQKLRRFITLISAEHLTMLLNAALEPHSSLELNVHVSETPTFKHLGAQVILLLQRPLSFAAYTTWLASQKNKKISVQVPPMPQMATAERTLRNEKAFRDWELKVRRRKQTKDVPVERGKSTVEFPPEKSAQLVKQWLDKKTQLERTKQHKAKKREELLTKRKIQRAAEASLNYEKWLARDRSTQSSRKALERRQIHWEMKKRERRKQECEQLYKAWLECKEKGKRTGDDEPSALKRALWDDRSDSCSRILYLDSQSHDYLFA